MSEPSKRSGTRGFGLLEAIVALAILAGTGLALFAWIGQNLREVGHIDEAQGRASLQLSALALLGSVNPFSEPDGERRVGGLKVRWHAEPIEPMRPSIPFSATSVRWNVGLYRVEVKAEDAAKGLSSEFSVEETGLELIGGGKPPPRQDPP